MSSLGLKPYSVVDFHQEGAVAVVSSSWLTKSSKGYQCAWPTVSGPSLSKLVMKHANPAASWKKFQCKLLKSYDNYSKARVGCAKAENTSNLETSEADALLTPKLRKRRKNSKFRQPSPSYSSSKSSSIKDSGSDFEGEIPLPGRTLADESDRLDSSIPELIPPTTSDQASTGETGEYQRTSALHYDYNIIRDENDFGAEFITAPIENPIYDLLQQIQEESRKFQDAAISKLVTIGSNLEEILRRIPVVADDGGIAQSSDCPRFPVPSLEKLEELNQWLHREGNLELLKKQLIYIGGKSASAITQRILNHLIENSVACKISLTGKGKKAEQGIKDTPVHHLLFQSVRSTKGAEATTNSEVDSYIKTWLKNASDRAGGREKRRKPSCSTSTAVDEPQIDEGNEK